MIELLSNPDAWLSLLVLSVMEIVLGIDNIVFVTILCGRLPVEQQLGARRLGIAVALVARLGLLFAISWVMSLTEVWFTFIIDWSGKGLILVGGGLFLLYKATTEIYENVEHPEDHGPGEPGPTSGETGRTGPSYASIIAQVMLLDIVFSLDSVITAVGMAEEVAVMAAAMVIAVVVMLVFAGPIGDFIEGHPSVRLLALAFLMLIGVMLMIEGTDREVSKGYIYSAMGFSLFVQMLNVRRDARAQRRAEEASES